MFDKEEKPSQAMIDKRSKTGAGKGYKTDKDTTCKVEIAGHPKVCIVVAVKLELRALVKVIRF